MIQCTNIFRSTSTKEEFIIHCTVTCQTTHSIYLLQCAVCDLQYVGTTDRQFNKRMIEHRSQAKGKGGTSLSRHLRSKNHHKAVDKLKVTIIEHNPNWDIATRLRREHFWIRKLDTLSPNGINEKK